MTAPGVIPVGTELFCPWCDRTLYRTVKDVPVDAPLLASMVERVDGVHVPETGALIECPRHGAVPANLRIPAAAKQAVA